MDPSEIKHIENCQFHEWYSLFKTLTPKARVLKAPEEFRAFLLQDGIHLPDYDNSSDSSEIENSDSDPEQSLVSLEFHNLIKNTINELGGAVCPKINWSAPRDALWISPTNNLRCVSPNDVYLLLKASDYCTHDLTQSLGDKGPQELVLVLREWFDLNPAMEFRCFVKDKKLVAISQRDMNYYDFLLELKPKIESLVCDLALNIVSKFPDDSFVMDVFIPKTYSKAWLVDINPFMERTDSLLFFWDEIKSWPKDKPFEMRLVGRQDASRQFSSVQHSENHVPHDFVDLQPGTVERLVEEMKSALKSQNES